VQGFMVQCLWFSLWFSVYGSVHGSVFMVQDPRRKRMLGGSESPSKAGYMGTSLIRNSLILGPYSRFMPRVLRGWQFRMSEVPL